MNENECEKIESAKIMCCILVECMSCLLSAVTVSHRKKSVLLRRGWRNFPLGFLFFCGSVLFGEKKGTNLDGKRNKFSAGKVEFSEF